jgi:hypothetical protein
MPMLLWVGLGALAYLYAQKPMQEAADVLHTLHDVRAGWAKLKAEEHRLSELPRRVIANGTKQLDALARKLKAEGRSATATELALQRRILKAAHTIASTEL